MYACMCICLGVHMDVYTVYHQKPSTALHVCIHVIYDGCIWMYIRYMYQGASLVDEFKKNVMTCNADVYTVHM